jgi:hypothetical protein
MTRPTIAELEKILAGGDGPHNIEMLPDGSIRAVPCRLAFGTGHLFVVTGLYEGQPAVFIAPASKPGEVGTYNAEEDGDPHTLKRGEYVLTFPTEAQAKAVADALCPKPV